MILISHRGNIDGPNEAKENSVHYILKALDLGYDVEIDVWRLDGDWYLGHSEPKYLIEEPFLTKKGLWCHAKNVEALRGLLALETNCFWHQEDDYTLTSFGDIWVYPGKQLVEGSICVMPEKDCLGDITICSGVCSDFIGDYR